MFAYQISLFYYIVFTYVHINLFLFFTIISPVEYIRESVKPEKQRTVTHPLLLFQTLSPSFLVALSVATIWDILKPSFFSKPRFMFHILWHSLLIVDKTSSQFLLLVSGLLIIRKLFFTCFFFLILSFSTLKYFFTI